MVRMPREASGAADVPAIDARRSYGYGPAMLIQLAHLTLADAGFGATLFLCGAVAGALLVRHLARPVVRRLRQR